MEIQLETAKAEHLEQYEEILRAGRRFQQEQGFIQWTENYPNRDTILEDIRFQRGYALLVDGAIAGYLCIDFAGEPAYENIDGAWRTAGPYAVVHRLALSSDFRGRGLGDAAFAWRGSCALPERVAASARIQALTTEGCSISLSKTALRSAA